MPTAAGDARMALIVERIRRIPPGSVRAYSDIDPEAPRLVGRVLATTHQELPWFRVIHADGSIPKGERQRRLLAKEGVPMRGDRVDIRLARLPRSDRSLTAGPGSQRKSPPR
ncbi:MAG TPA: MGMT family protein [Candidatus Dormibacteraeota bacterium]|nr:MGMT family protein [Candidatus Dormibacteraeota bacterium]